MEKIYKVNMEYLNFKNMVFPRFGIFCRDFDNKPLFNLYSLILNIYNIPPLLKERNFPEYRLFPFPLKSKNIESIEDFLVRENFSDIQLIKTNVNEKYVNVIAYTHSKRYENEMKDLIKSLVEKKDLFKTFLLPRIVELDELSSLQEVGFIKPKLF